MELYAVWSQTGHVSGPKTTTSTGGTASRLFVAGWPEWSSAVTCGPPASRAITATLDGPTSTWRRPTMAGGSARPWTAAAAQPSATARAVIAAFR